jgi:transcriptional regulator with XRE-family HTH domain
MRRPGVDPRFGQKMRELRTGQAKSLRALAGRLLVSKSQLAAYEAGETLPPRAVAARIDAELGAGGELVALVDDERAMIAAVDGLEFPDSLPRAVAAATRLWRSDAAGRGQVRRLRFDPAAFLGPAMRSLAAPAGERLVGTGHGEVDDREVEVVRRMASTLSGLDNEYGGGAVRDFAVSFLAGSVSPLLAGRFAEPVGRQLLSAAAELTRIAGWATYDCGWHGLAQRYLIQALRLAHGAADLPLTAEVLAAMSHQAAFLGAAVEAVDLARAAGRVAADAGIPALVAEAAVSEAHGYAVARDEQACADALHRADQALDRADRSRDPAWIGYFDAAYLAARFGHCFTALRRGEVAERFARRSLDMDERFVRGKQFNLALAATALLDQPDPKVDEAAALGVQAVEVAEGLRSTRAVDRIKTLAGRLGRYCGVAEVDDFHERARPLLAAR